MKKIRQLFGYTIIELLIGLLITGVVASAGFKFYVEMHNQTLVQENISDMQQNLRSTYAELEKNIRMAGFKLSGHVPFSVRTDSLFIFYSESQPVDTILYYLADYNTSLYPQFASLSDAQRPRQLMKKVNSNPAAAFADNIRTMIITAINSSTIEISIETMTDRADEEYSYNRGFRTYSMTERINLRNI